jgi:putative ABC transport system substrate-binding protein
LKSALATAGALPIVMIAIDYDPLALGYVMSFARPGGNITGLLLQQIDLAAKRVQLMKDAFPDRQTATVFWDAASAEQWQATQDAAATLALRLPGSSCAIRPMTMSGHSLNRHPTIAANSW